MLRYEKVITRQMLRDNPETLFVFGDNLARVGLGGQAREMRGEPNAVGIPTKRALGMGEEDFFTDADLERVKRIVSDCFVRLASHVLEGRDVVWPAYGIGTGLAELPHRAPKIWALIENLRKSLEQIAAMGSLRVVDAKGAPRG